eukprot:TRINITY_DN106110_c0_g1_i1.p1 TRINITY_DN106110_c0_g1~~TRINITY_DN106110_c0_g1_i1.p1  ORF type:complete len:292 (+),score=16.91 TRINITY_DN106110_c0_g1_i1:3-878(+)
MIEQLNRQAEDVLWLDVGGIEIHTTRDTLCSGFGEGGMLSCWFDGPWQIDIEPEDDCVLVDRDSDRFVDGILPYLRDGLEMHRQVPFNREWAHELQREAVFFALDPLVHWCEIHARPAPFDWWEAALTVTAPGNFCGIGIALGLKTKIEVGESYECFIELQNSGHFVVGFICECSYVWPSPEQSDFRWGSCEWGSFFYLDSSAKAFPFCTQHRHVACTNLRCATEGDIIGCHVGDEQVWFSINGDPIVPETGQRMQIVNNKGVKRTDLGNPPALIPYIRLGEFTKVRVWRG